MTSLERALFTARIRRLGKAKVVELTASITGGTTGEKLGKLIKSKSEEELAPILLDGFDGYYHQTVYMRRVKQAEKLAKAISNAEYDDDVRVLTTLANGKRRFGPYFWSGNE